MVLLAGCYQQEEIEKPAVKEIQPQSEIEKVVQPIQPIQPVVDWITYVMEEIEQERLDCIEGCDEMYGDKPEVEETTDGIVYWGNKYKHCKRQCNRISEERVRQQSEVNS